MSEQKDTLTISLEAAAKNLLRNWYIIAAFVLLMVMVTFIYLRVSSVTYSVGASILLRIDNNNRMSDTPDFLSAFDLTMNDRNFQNEIFFLQSYPLIFDVVQRMDVRTSYYLKESYIPKRFTWSLQNIYKSSPIMVIPNEGHHQPVNMFFRVAIIDDNRFRLYGEGENVELIDPENEITVGRLEDFKLEGVYNFRDVISNEHAAFRVLLNSNYNPEMLEGKDLFFRFNNLNHVASQFKGSLSVTPQGQGSRGIQSTMVNLSFTAENVDLGREFLNQIIETYIERNMEEANLLANQTIEHIDRLLENISDDLGASEQQLQNIRSRRSVISVEDKSRRIFDQLQAAQTRREEVQRRISHLTQMDDYFVLYKDSAKILAPSSLGLNDPVLNNLIQELTALNTEKQRIISQDQLRNPRLVTLDISINNLKNVIAENITFSLSTAKKEQAELNSRIEALNREVSQLPATQRELLGVERRFNLNDATYTSLLERRIHAQIVKASTLPDAKIMEYPGYRGVASPKRTMLYAMSFFWFAHSLHIYYGKTLILNHITGKDDIKYFTQIPVISTIPAISQCPGKSGDQ
jgi:tyrosine-protein kinase Etk/Wzc